MAIHLYSHSRQDLERAVEIILQKANALVSAQQRIQDEKTDDLIPQNEAAEFLKVSLPTIIDWRKNKGLPYYNFSGRFYYSKSELLEYGRNRNRKMI
ncbi:helix-turn-helix domain-containing protein [Cruoricaptor ignavus]|uniref:helix-turn-helix domain-containing protein n=1 Tax=Cruoricaptor ignavus TaxID=1118202 RepID=UPI00370D51B1